MESDDDYQLLTQPNQLSPPVQHRRLKRLKKAVTDSDEPPLQSVEEGLLLSPSESHESRELETSEIEISNEPEDEGVLNPPPQSSELNESDAAEIFGVEDSNEQVQSQSSSDGFDDLFSDGDCKKTKRALDFDDMVGGSEDKGFDPSGVMVEESAGTKMKRSDKKRSKKEGSSEDKTKKKKVKSGSAEAKPKTSSSNKKREEKERQAHLQQLHAESQRLLRETRDAAFKPIPIVQKPISSILEKIRQRKLEVLKKSIVLSSNCPAAEDTVCFGNASVNIESENVSIDERELQKSRVVSSEETTTTSYVDVEEGNLDSSHANILKESSTHSSPEKVTPQIVADEGSAQPFRAPLDDTQDLSFDSQSSDSKDELNDHQYGSLEEVLAPSALAMKLKFDSAPPDDLSSDEEDNDKENTDPHPRTLENERSSPKGDPVKAFVDDEAMEEDDDDHDMLRFCEDEEEDNEDFEELKDLIATGFVEEPIDNERRNELHQKWLEQQDATGTENLMQRLKCRSVPRGPTLLEEKADEDEDEEEEEFSDEDTEDPQPRINARLNSKKAKEMISKMFSDKDDPYLSSDDEETEKMLIKQRLLFRAEEQHTSFSSADDDSSSVFSLIKKLNVVPETKKKAKTSSFFDTMATGGIRNSSSKSSFLGRASSHSLPSSRKPQTSMMRSFIFGRDDSSSRSEISVSEDSCDMAPKENPPPRNHTTKFSSSQSKSSATQRSSNIAAAETVAASTSLFDLLKRSSSSTSTPTVDCKKNDKIGLTQTVFTAFKIPKKSVKMEGRNQ